MNKEEKQTIVIPLEKYERLINVEGQFIALNESYIEMKEFIDKLLEIIKCNSNE